MFGIDLNDALAVIFLSFVIFWVSVMWHLGKKFIEG